MHYTCPILYHFAAVLDLLDKQLGILQYSILIIKISVSISYQAFFSRLEVYTLPETNIAPDTLGLED